MQRRIWVLGLACAHAGPWPIVEPGFLELMVGT